MMGAQPGTRARMRLLVWGGSTADVETAVRKAGQGWARNGWEFVSTERLEEARCPIDIQDPKAIAADAGYDWAYAVYPIRDQQ